jgi:hypothetical protein
MVILDSFTNPALIPGPIAKRKASPGDATPISRPSVPLDYSSGSLKRVGVEQDTPRRSVVEVSELLELKAPPLIVPQASFPYPVYPSYPGGAISEAGIVWVSFDESVGRITMGS